MKTSVFKFLFGLQILGSSFAKPVPETAEIEKRQTTFSLSVWNHFNSPIRYVGVVQLVDEAFVYNYTSGATDFDVYLDPTISSTKGLVKRASDDAILQMAPSDTYAGVYSVFFDTTYHNTSWQGTWGFDWLICGQCNGNYLYWNATDNPGNNAGFFIVPRADVQGSWDVIFSTNWTALPSGYAYINILKS
ncbi:hypothetical protein RUND412_000346 [Rhizina undulata]